MYYVLIVTDGIPGVSYEAYDMDEAVQIAVALQNQHYPEDYRDEEQLVSDYNEYLSGGNDGDIEIYIGQLEAFTPASI